MKGIVVLATALALTGCGTLVTQTRNFNKGMCDTPDVWPIPRVYSGTVLDIWAVAQGGEMGGYLFWDIPFSLIADTVILPYTAFRQIRDGSHKCASVSSQSAGGAQQSAPVDGSRPAGESRH